MTPSDAFKAGFLLRCADEGLSVAETDIRLTRAMEKMSGLLSGAFDVVKGLAGALGQVGTTALIAAPPVAGATAGWALGHSGGADQPEIEEAKQQELIAEYRRLAEQAKRMAEIRRLRQQ